MVEHRVGEAVLGQRVAVVVVVRPQGPVVAQALGAQHQHAVVALLVVLDHGQRLVGLAQAHAVGDDAALVFLQLADGAHHGVLLEVVEVVPHGRLLELEAGADVVVAVAFQEVAEQVVEGEEIDELGRVLAVERLHLGGHLGRDVGGERGVCPHGLEHRLEAGRLGRALEMAHSHDGAGLALVAQALLGEVCGGAHEGVVVAGGVLHDVRAARLDGARYLCRAERALRAYPIGALAGKGPLVQVVAQRELQARAAHAALTRRLREFEFARVPGCLHALHEGRLAEEEAHLVDLRELVLELAVGKDGEIRADYRELGAVVHRPREGIAQPLGPHVVQEFHRAHPSGLAFAACCAQDSSGAGKRRGVHSCGRLKVGFGARGAGSCDWRRMEGTRFVTDPIRQLPVR